MMGRRKGDGLLLMFTDPTLTHKSASRSDIDSVEPPPLKGADFSIDPEATPPVRSLRSQSFHTSSGRCARYQIIHKNASLCSL